MEGIHTIHFLELLYIYSLQYVYRKKNKNVRTINVRSIQYVKYQNRIK